MQANKESNNHRRRGIAGVIGSVVVVSAASLLGCGQPSDPGAGPTGTLTVALEAVGSDGATYQFAPGSFLWVSNTTSHKSGAFALEGTDTVLTKSLPIGNYEASLSFPGGDTPQLIRTVNQTSQTVPATWSDPQPVTFSIVHDVRTPLLLHFSVVGLGDVTFETGRLQVSIDVSPTTTTMANHGQETATFTETGQSIAAGSGLETPLALVAGETDSESLTFDLTSAFALTGGGSVCAAITVRSIRSPSSSRAFSALMEEGGAGIAGEICINDGGDDDDVQIDYSRNGAAPAGQQAFLPGTNYSFHMLIVFRVGDVFDGTVLKLSKLGVPIPLGAANGASLFQGVVDFDTNQNLESCHGSLTGTFQLTP